MILPSGTGMHILPTLSPNLYGRVVSADLEHVGATASV